MRKQVSNCLWMGPWGQGQGVAKGSPRGTRRTWGDRPAHSLGHSDDFECVCTCVCPMPQTAHKCVHLYSNKAVKVVIKYRISQYITKQHVESDETWKSMKARVRMSPLPRPSTQSPEPGTRIMRTGSDCAYVHTQYTTHTHTPHTRLHTHNTCTHISIHTEPATHTPYITHASTHPAPHPPCDSCHLPREPLGSA